MGAVTEVATNRVATGFSEARATMATGGAFVDIWISDVGVNIVVRVVSDQL